jgi:hypothetical protein
MFPFCFGFNCSPASRQDYLNHKLRYLKMMRDSFETRLSALNAAIATVERQISDEQTSSSTSNP